MLGVMNRPLDHDRCYRAVASRDARFDGWFFTAVHTTGIYCRPSCPARTPLARNVSFFTTAAAAQGAGMTEGRWWTAMAPHVERFPTVARVGPVAGNDLQAASAPERSFEFGLERLLDGIGVLILNASR